MKQELTKQKLELQKIGNQAQKDEKNSGDGKVIEETKESVLDKKVKKLKEEQRWEWDQKYAGGEMKISNDGKTIKRINDGSYSIFGNKVF